MSFSSDSESAFSVIVSPEGDPNRVIFARWITPVVTG